jgi:hypothetical protein
MVKRIIFVGCLLSCCLLAAAQESLNLYTTTKGIISFTFEQEPRVTFPTAETLLVTAGDVTVEFPFSEVEKITFEEGLTSVESITVREGDTQVSIYDLSGRMVRQYVAKEGSATVSLSSLPAGTYIIKDGKRAYKVMKR